MNTCVLVVPCPVTGLLSNTAIAQDVSSRLVLSGPSFIKDEPFLFMLSLPPSVSRTPFSNPAGATVFCADELPGTDFTERNRGLWRAELSLRAYTGNSAVGLWLAVCWVLSMVGVLR